MTKEEEFVQGLYDESEEEIKEIYKEQKENRDNLLKELALIMLTYTILDGLMSLTSKDKNNEYNRLSSLIIKATKGQGAAQEKVIKDVLTNTVKKTFGFYSYNANLKDVRKIIENTFKEKHFSTRVWENENEVARHLHKQVNDFLNGKVNVNQIKRDIEKTYNTSAYNAKRLVETEVNRCSSNAFDRFCKETDVKKVRYNATLDKRTCDDCGQYHDRVFNLREKIDTPRHPLCRCFYTIEDDESVLDKTDYMANRFVPEFGEGREFKLGNLSINEKRVSNSGFNMWTDIDATKKNKAVRLYEKKLKNIKGELPDWFEMPRVSIIDFEKNDLPQNAIGGYKREVNIMFINSKYDTDAKILKYLKSKEGFFANVESNSPLTHELGHKYHYDLVELIANQKRLSYNNAKEIFDSGIENYILSKSSIPNRFIENQLSGYAADSYIGIDRVNEIIAEYFSIRGNNNKTELVQFIEDYIKGVEKP
jgi:SPP1 gp7 family putative phage head morphogenesis protein